MAEAALFTIASKVLSTVAAPAFEKAYKKACSIKNAPDELNKLKTSIGTIQSVLLDAERKQKDSSAVKDWMKRVKDVLYDADDLFDEVATDDLLRRHVEGSNTLVKKVRVNFSRLNPIVSNNDIANRVKNIRERLVAISEDMRAFNFVECRQENPVGGMRKLEQDPGSFVDPKNVVGRDEDKEVILDWLLHDQSNDPQDVQVISIVGIGGIGKTTLTQLVYNHEGVKRSFEKRWFACISDTSDDTEVSRKICESVCGMVSGEILHSTSNLQAKIYESIEGKKFLLVLDDVWDDHRGRWQNRMSLLSSGARGSKIIVSTRSSTVARAVGALRTHMLKGLSEEHSWDLFKRVVSFTPEQEADSRWTDLGREIVKKCANVPLAINCIASFLFGKNTIQEWELIRDEELPRLGESHEDGIMPVLKLSYEHLLSDLKHCFAYCSLFPKDHVFEKEELIKLWIAQGYINPNNEKQTVENIGHSYFMDLVRRSFFRMEFGVDTYCKMHDLMHDLAIHVAGEESLMLTASSNKSSGTRHMSVGYAAGASWLLSEPLHSVSRLRSLFFLTNKYPGSKLVLGKQFENLKSLRALSLRFLGIENVPSSIGELKHLRYLDISGNTFDKLPNSVTKLVNLCTLNISRCESLEVWPNNFRKLINLRHLHNHNCCSLKDLPPGFEELASLQHLDEFRVDKGMVGGPRFKLDALPKLKLSGELTIWFKHGANAWDGVECWQPPLTLQKLKIYYYSGTRMPHWGNGRTVDHSVLPKLSSLSLSDCPRVKCLPPFRHIPNLKQLFLWKLDELEYIEDAEAASDALFIPHLEELGLHYLPKLKGWSRKVEHHSSSTSTAPPHLLISLSILSRIFIIKCPELKYMPLCPRLRFMELDSLTAEQMQQLQLLPSDHTSSPSITTSTSCLEHVIINSFDWMESFPGKSLTCLQHLTIHDCIKLKKVDLPPLQLNNLEYLLLMRCPELELWEEKRRGVDWDSLPKLIELEIINGAPSPVRLPDCLLQRQQLGQLRINIRENNMRPWLSHSNLEEASLPSTSTVHNRQHSSSGFFVSNK